jgi:hypothetical protein
VSIAEVLAEKLSGKRTGFVCCCPAHEDTDPSLSIMEADDGGLIVHCFANCAALDVYAALRRMNVLSDTSTPVERPVINNLQAQKSRPNNSANRPLNLLGGASWRWRGTPPLSPAKRRAIIEAEIGSVSS